MIVIAYQSLFRGEEVSSLKLCDVWMDTIVLLNGTFAPTLFLLLRDWKTRNGRSGRVQLLCQDLKNPWKCPVLLFNAYTTRLLSVATSAVGYVFVGTKPFGKKLSKKHLNFSVKSFAKACGLRKLGCSILDLYV